MDQTPGRENQNEFEWEKDLKKDDARIRMYSRLLPEYMDLQDEDRLILEEIQKDPALSLPEGEAELLMPLPFESENGWEEEEDDDDGEEESSPENGSGKGKIFPLHQDDSQWETTRGAEIYKQTSVLARELAVFSAQGLSMGTEETMVILTSYGRLLSLSNEYIDMELSLRDPEAEHPPVPLRIAYVKRMLASVNELMGEFLALGEKGKLFYQEARKHLALLNPVRTMLLEIMTDLRTPQ